MLSKETHKYKLLYAVEGELNKRILEGESLALCLNKFLEENPEVEVFACIEV